MILISTSPTLVEMIPLTKPMMVAKSPSYPLLGLLVSLWTILILARPITVVRRRLRPSLDGPDFVLSGP